MIIVPRNNWEPKEGLSQRQVEFGVRWWAEQALDDLFKDPSLFVAAYESDLLGKLREVVRAFAFAKLAAPAKWEWRLNVMTHDESKPSEEDE